METASKEKRKELIKLFLTRDMIVKLSRKLIKGFSDEELNISFRENIIIKNNREISPEELMMDLEIKINNPKEKTLEKIIEIVLEKAGFLENLSNNEIDRIIANLNTAQGFVIRDLISILLENAGDLIKNSVDEISEDCYDHIVELVDLNKKIDPKKTNAPEMN